MASSVLITGCSTGIGRATAARLAAGGRTVYATARRPETLSELEAAGCRTLALDVTDEASMQAAVDAVEGGVGVLDQQRRLLAVGSVGDAADGVRPAPVRDERVRAAADVPARAAGDARGGRGKIVNVSSMGGRLTFPGGGAYHATKYAVEAMSDALRMEVGRFGIDVICVEPGLIRTEFGSTAASSVGDGGPYAEFNEAVARSTREVYEGPLSRFGGDADDVAVAIEKALSKRRAPTRVPVTASARIFMGLRRVLPDRAWDRIVSASFR